MSDANPILRQPNTYDLEQSGMARYRDWLRDRGEGTFPDYASLHEWSVNHLDAFWESIWDYTGTVAERRFDTVLSKREMPGAEWFQGARLNFARNLLREAIDGDDSKIALTAVSESRPRVRLTYSELLSHVGAMQSFLRSCGVSAGDRVAAMVTNGPEALIAMLATAGIGAVWSSASPDFGVSGVMDRFGQIEPKVLIAVNGYRYNGKDYSRLDEVRALGKRLSSAREVIVIDNLPGAGMPSGEHFNDWSDAMAEGEGDQARFEVQDFNHPLYILFSSGTTGAPKCIVHSAGGTLLQHSKELMLHGDIQGNDVFFYFTTCGWMMWNWLVSGLLTGAELVLFDGSPSYPDVSACWRLSEELGITHFGTSAKFLGACRNANLRPGGAFDLSRLRTIFSTGSPLLPEDFDWVYDAVKKDVSLASIAGGTDIVSCFVGGCPLRPVRRGEIQCVLLGMDVHAYSEEGKAVIGERGELVCTQPAPCMPVGFWDDPKGERYRAAYFERFPGVWAQGDFIEITKQGGAIIYGRSDATLNPGGVRIGTAEIYRQVETLDEISDSIVAGQNWEDDQRIVLLVVLNTGFSLDDELEKKIRGRIRANASPRHVPARIVAVEQIPYTRSGKKVELAVSKILNGDKVKNREAIANPHALEAIAAERKLFT